MAIKDITEESKEERAKVIVKKVQTLYTEQLKESEKKGYHHPALYVSTGGIQKLIIEFERITKKDWDKEAKNYL